MFHSSGTTQSNILVPLGISVRLIGICSSSTSNVARTPSPVRLRQSGNSRSISVVTALGAPIARTALRQKNASA